MQQSIVKITNAAAHDISTKGIHIADITNVIVATPAATTADVYITLEDTDLIAAGTAEWFLYESVIANSYKFYIFEFAPTGIKVVPSGAGVKVWVKH